MVQRVWVQMDASNQPVAEPHDLNIWTDDQYIGWKLLLPDDWGWDSDHAGGPIVMPETWFKAGGSPPVPSGTPPASGPDRRLYNAVGPGPAVEKPEKFSYEIFLQGPGGARMKARKDFAAAGAAKATRTGGGASVPVDPDISNQPQP